ncbi:MAG: hypothetical protein RLZZ338_2656 [Cyanobacteriota bacterium]|jgi:hypothetical protein
MINIVKNETEPQRRDTVSSLGSSSGNPTYIYV